MYCIAKKINKQDLLFFPAWILYVITVIVDLTMIAIDNNTVQMINKAIRYLVYGICAFKVLNTNYKKRSIIYIVLFIVFFFLSYYRSNSRTMVLYSLIMLAAYNLSNEKIIKTTAYTQGLLLLMIILLSQTGIIMDYVFDKGTRERHSLGFTWTTLGPIIFFYFAMCFVYVHRKNLKWYTILILEGINIWLFRMTNTRMTFYLLTLFLVFFFLESINRKRFRYLSLFKGVYIIYPFILWLLAILTCKFYNRNSQMWSNINGLLSGRLNYSQDALNNYGLGLFGNNIEWKGFSILNTSYGVGEYNYVDSSYLQLTFNYGLIFTAVVMIIFSYGIYKAIKANDYYCVFVYIAVLTISLTEPQLMNFAFNPFSLLAFGTVTKDIMRRCGKYIHRYKRKWKLSTGETKQTI